MVGPARADVHEHVGRLDVAVDQARGVRCVERGGDRGDDRGDPGGRQRALAAQQAAGVAAGHVAHGDEQHAGRLAGLEHRDDVRVVDGGRGPRLADEPLPEGLVLGQARAQHLQGDRAAEPLVVGAEDDGHAAGPDALLQPVAGDPGAGAEPAGRVRQGAGRVVRRSLTHRSSRVSPSIPCLPDRAHRAALGHQVSGAGRPSATAPRAARLRPGSYPALTRLLAQHNGRS